MVTFRKENAMTEQTDEKKKKKEGRSPSYPAVDLSTALVRAQAIKEKEGRHFANIPTIMTHWGYGAKSSQGFVVLAALKKFGLLEDRGTGGAREFRLTELAWNILIDTREVSVERESLIRKAALSPDIHRKLWEEYGADLPSSENLRFRLLSQERFTSGAVDDFIAEYKRTISFANLKESDSLNGHEEDKTAMQEERIMPGTQPISSLEAKTRNPVEPQKSETTGAVHEFNMALSDGKTAYLRIPHSLKKGDWEQINKLLAVLEPADE